MATNRRQWLKSAGAVSGLFSIIGANAMANPIPFGQYLQDKTIDHRPPDSLIKLSSNENPYGPSPYVREAIAKAFDSVCRYPVDERTALTKKIAEKEGVSPAHILLTVGSTEGLKSTALAYCQGGGELVAGDPTFEAMLYYAEHFGTHIHRVPVLDGSLGLDLQEMEKRITTNTRLVFLCNPNNPTGTVLPAAQLKDFCASVSKKTMLFSDEAYYDYVTEPGYPSMVEMVKDNQNVIVSRTFSKVYGLAGIRLGYLVARPDIITRIGKCQQDRPNMLALHAGTAALDEPAFYRQSLDLNDRARGMIYQALDGVGAAYVRSHANFVFFKTGLDSSVFNKSMQEHGIRVGRPFPPYNDWCRVSTGRLEDMKVLAAALGKVLG